MMFITVIHFKSFQLSVTLHCNPMMGWWCWSGGEVLYGVVVVLDCVISWPRKDDSPDVLLSDALVVRLRIESDAGCWTD